MFQRILVPLDGSPRAERAIPLAARLARASKGTLVFVRVVLPPHEVGTYSAEWGQIPVTQPGVYEKRLVEAEQYLKKVTFTYEDDLSGITVELDTETGAAAPAIFSAARLEAIDLIVLCSHGETGLKRWIFGSIAQKAVRHSPVPVLVLNERAEVFGRKEVPHPLRMLVPLDGSALSESALAPTVQLLTALSASDRTEIHLFHVVDTHLAYEKAKYHLTDTLHEDPEQKAQTYVKSVAERCKTAFAGSNLFVRSSIVIDTDIAGAIIKEATFAKDLESPDGYDLIALATHGRGGLGRLLMGSVTEHLLGATPLPLLIVRPHKELSKEEALKSAERGEMTESIS